jgi:SAM-dependent methyltransferase
MAAGASTDLIGTQTLERLATGAPKYNRWIWDRIRPWVGRRVLEIGAGLGVMSQFLAERQRLVATDVQPYYLQSLRRRFADRANVRVAELRLPGAGTEIAVEQLDTVVCLNVLEHIADDVGSLRAMHRLLQPAGRVIVLVPALPAIYGTLDEALGHVRRYTKRELGEKFERAGLRIVHHEYLNLPGIPGWWFTGRVLRRRVIPTSSLALYDALVPLFRLERHLPWRVGQSLIVVGDAPA